MGQRGKKVEISKKQLQQVIRKKLTTAEAAEFFNCSISTIFKFQRLYQLPAWKHTKAKIKISKEDLQKVITTGLTLLQVCKKFNCSKSTIWNNCKSYNLHFPKSLDDSITDMRRHVLNSYKTGALGRNKEWQLSDQQFYSIATAACTYCGRQNTNCLTNKSHPGVSKNRLPFYFTGIDRKDSSKGYTLENSVPCCKTCNYAKNDLTIEEFNDWKVAFVNHNKDVINTSTN